NSTAAAKLMALPWPRPNRMAAATVSIGRRRLPPLSMRYRASSGTMSTCDSARLRINALTLAMSSAVAAISRSTALVVSACFVWVRTETAITVLFLGAAAKRVEPATPAHIWSRGTSHPGAMSLDQPNPFVKHQTITRDAFLGGKLIVSQPSHGFRAGLDSVLLGAAIPRGTNNLLDLGAGVGTASLVS